MAITLPPPPPLEVLYRMVVRGTNGERQEYLLQIAVTLVNHTIQLYEYNHERGVYVPYNPTAEFFTVRMGVLHTVPLVEGKWVIPSLRGGTYTITTRGDISFRHVNGGSWGNQIYFQVDGTFLIRNTDHL